MTCSPLQPSLETGHHELAPLRWNLLFVACELSDPRSADFLLRTAMRKLPQPRRDDAAGNPRSGEILIRVLAIEALHAIAKRHPHVREHFVRLIASRPEPCVLYEAVRAAEDLGLGDRIKDMTT